jgi:hypothetical protein
MAAQCLQVANIVTATLGEGDDMVYLEFGISTTTFTPMVISIEDIRSHFWRDGDTRSFGHYILTFKL